MNKICGIYMIKNKCNNKIYVGKSIDIYTRWNTGHIRLLEKNKHRNSHLQQSWDKYGKSNFEFSIIEPCEKELLNEKEIYWINYYKSYDSKYGYNMTYGGEGEKPTEETKQKISKTLKNNGVWNKGKTNVYSEETLKQMSESARNRPKPSEETKKKISESIKGTKQTKETIQKRSESLKGKPAWNKGKTNVYSEETLKQMSESHKGKDTWNKGKTNVYSEETLEKMRQARKGEKNSMYGKHLPEETKQKISKANKGKESPFKGKKHSKKSLEKMSNSLKGRKAPNKISFPNDDIIIMINKHNSGDSYYAIGQLYGINKGTVKRLIDDYEHRQGNPNGIDLVSQNSAAAQSSAEEVTRKEQNT